MKIVYLPLDERPCNADFPVLLFSDAANLVSPKKELLGDKKLSADCGKLIAFLKRECVDADALVCSLEMLLYGGLLPSRLHHLEKEVVEERLAVLSFLKQENPRLKIYAISLIMRCPRYSSDEEEPDYYGECGTEIHRLGALLHQKSLGMETENEDALREKIPPEALNDYTARRAFNLHFNKRAAEERKRGIIDCLLIPQDDSAPYGFTAMDREEIKKTLLDLGLSDVPMYAGADEAGLTLLARCLQERGRKSISVFVRYAAKNAEKLIPLYEDKPLLETVRSHLLAAGCRLEERIEDADLVLLVTSCPIMGEAKFQRDLAEEYDQFRDLSELCDFLKDALQQNKAVAVADNAYANGGDLRLLEALNKNALLPLISAYAGWNTDGNTLGTAIAQGVHFVLCGGTQAHFDFLALRYLEDFGYCSKVRFETSEHLPAKYRYVWVGEKRGEVAEDVRKRLQQFLKEYMPSVCGEIEIRDVFLPWRRLFEVGLSVHWKRR